jgi:hypothetical protein
MRVSNGRMCVIYWHNIVGSSVERFEQHALKIRVGHLNTARIVRNRTIPLNASAMRLGEKL